MIEKDFRGPFCITRRRSPSSAVYRGEELAGTVSLIVI
jgi:hypothetical protein